MELPVIDPRFDGRGVGWCDDSCQQYDGKRCRLLGYRPAAICEPWARQAAAMINKWPDVVQVGK